MHLYTIVFKRGAGLAFASLLLNLIFLLSSQAGAQTAPDLVVSNITWDTNEAGVPVTFSARVTNQGSAPTPNGVWIGVLFTVDTNNVAWGATGTSLAPGESVVLTAIDGPTGVPTWNSTPGVHQILATVDDVNRMDESNETNNQAHATWISAPPKPDLVVSHITWDTTQAGCPVTFSATVTNRGAAPTPDGIWIGLLFNVDGVNIGWGSTGTALAPGASVVLTAHDGPAGSYTWTSAPGAHQVLATVDGPNRIIESNETNNQATASWTADLSQPDLVVSNITWDTHQLGAPVTFSATVTNQGTAPTPAGVWIGLLFNVDGINIGWGSTGTPLAPGASVVLTAHDGPGGSYTWTSTPGVHQVSATVDGPNRILESNENNNQTAVILGAAMLQPDLVVSNITPDTSQPGRPVVFSATVTNVGTGAVPLGGVIHLLFNVDGGDVGWGSQAISLMPGASTILTASDGPGGSYTWTAISGVHQIRATVDADNLIAESNETNNTTLLQMSVSAGDQAVVGQWSQVYNLVPSGYNLDDDHRSAFVPIHMVTLPNGKVLCWGRDPEDIGNAAAACEPTLSFIWDPASPGAPVTVFDPAEGSSSITDCMFCAGHSFLPDGRLLVAGGHVDDNSGLNATNIFDFRTNTWTKSQNNMIAGRWYPTTTTLPDGTVFVGGGSDEHKAYVRTQEVWQTNNPNPYWKSLTGMNVDMGYYPWLFVAPNGKLFWAGPGETSTYIDPSGVGSWPYQGWATTTNLWAIRNYGTSLQYDSGKVLIMGGYPSGDIQAMDATNTAEVINLSDSSPSWRQVQPMAHARAYANSTILPDGTVLVTGGTYKRNNDWTGAIYTAELWNPQTETFTKMAPASVPRLYHSTAVLLPDGRVAVAGGGMWPYRPIVLSPPYNVEGAHPDLEIYSPPYLFKGARPSIISGPSTIHYGQAFFVATPDATAIKEATLIRLSATTHSFNQNQHFNRLSFVSAGGGLTITPPLNSNLCPPGDYMLFIVNSAGVPSIAQMVNIR